MKDGQPRRRWVRWALRWAVIPLVYWFLSTIVSTGAPLPAAWRWTFALGMLTLAGYVIVLALWSLLVVWGEVGAWLIDRRRHRPRATPPGR